MKLYNTLGRTKETFTPADGDVRLYVCGVTPYDTTHLGHARTYLIFDCLLRHLRASGHTVRYVQNVTDVDDSILRRASELGEPYRELGERYTRVYLEDVRALGMQPAESYPRATEAIDDMQVMIERLLAGGHAYTRDGDVFFRIASASTFGELSGLSRERMLELESQQDAPHIDDRRKEDPLDFPLWQAAKPGEPAWQSPWGPGRPGWHLECSTLALAGLGPQVDIHGGGTDLVYPHHECEIVQSEGATGVRPFVRYWMHAGLVTLGGEKMSKSEGNMIFVRDLLRRWSTDAIRLYLLRSHYREPFDHDERALADMADVAARLASAASPPTGETPGDVDARDDEQAVLAALDDDLDTPRAVRTLAALADAIHEARGRGRSAAGAQATLRSLGERLGLTLEPPTTTGA